MDIKKNMKNQGFLKRNSSYKGHTAKIIVFMMLCLTLFPLVSAFDFDNQGFYDDQTQTMTIKDCSLWIFTCLIEGQTIAEIQLISPPTVLVFRGEDRKVAEFKITTFENYKSAFTDMNFYNVKDSLKQIQRNFNYKFQDQEDNITVNDYERSCQILTNATGEYESCEDILIGTHEEEVFEWRAFNTNTELGVGEFNLGIFTDVQAEESVEWMPTLFGVEINEWAIFNESMTLNLVHYWTFDDDDRVGSTVTDIRGADTGIEQADGVSHNINYIAGKSEQGSDILNAITENVTFAGTFFDDLLNTSYPFTMSLWINRTDGSTDTEVLGKGSNANNNAFTWELENVAGMRAIWEDNSGGRFAVTTNNDIGYEDTWHSVVMIYYGCTTSVNCVDWIIDGVNDTTKALTSGFTAPLVFDGQPLVVGMSNWGATSIQGMFDEFAIWNRTLSLGEVKALATGEFYEPIPPDTAPPNVINNTPLNKTYDTLTIIFNVTATDSTMVDSCLYSLNDGVTNYTMNNATANEWTDTNSTMFKGGHRVNFYCNDSLGYWNVTEFVDFNIDIFSTITLTTPVDYFNTSSQVDDFEFNITTPVDWVNYTFRVWDSIDAETKNRVVINGTPDADCIEYYYDGSIIVECIGQGINTDDTYEWNVLGCLNNGVCNWSASNYTFTYDASKPTFSLTSPVTNNTTTSLPINISLNVTSLDPHLDSCWYSTNEDVTNLTYSCNTTVNNVSFADEGVYTITYCANDSFANENCSSVSNTIFYYHYDQNLTPSSVGEGGNVTFTLYVNMTDITDTVANLTVNNTNYTDAVKTEFTNYTKFVKTITIPDGWGNITGHSLDVYWNYSIETIANDSTDIINFSVFSMEIDDCSIYGDIILNLSLRDEEGNTFINTSADATNIEIDLTLTSDSQTWNYSHQWTNENNVTICVANDTLNFTEYTIDFTIGFDADNHVNEFYYLDNGTLDNSTTINSLTDRVINLMDLLTADSTSFLFNYFDEDGLIVDNIIIHVYRKYIGEGLFREVERAKQNDDGDTIIHLVEEDVIYYFIISQNSTVLFTSSTYTALCQTTPCEIQLEESGGFQEFDSDWDLIEDGGYTIVSSSTTRIVNLTYTLTTPSTMNLTIYKLESDGTYDLVGSEQSTSTSGELLITVPVISGNTSFFASVYENGDFVKSQWIDFEEDAGLYFGNTLSLFLGALIILVLGLMAVAEGGGVIIFLILGMFIAMVLGLVDYRTSTGLNVLIYLIIAGGIILWKITRRNR